VPFSSFLTYLLFDLHSHAITSLEPRAGNANQAEPSITHGENLNAPQWTVVKAAPLLQVVAAVGAASGSATAVVAAVGAALGSATAVAAAAEAPGW